MTSTYYKVAGWSPKGNVLFVCQAVDEDDAKQQFEIAAKQANYGPVIWDHSVVGCPEYATGKVSLMFSSPFPGPTPPITDWRNHDFELYIQPFKLNAIEEYP
jgi:hypothetical protein